MTTLRDPAPPPLPGRATGRTVDFRYAPPQTWTAICRPDDPHKTLVREDGALLYGFRAASFHDWAFDSVLEFSAQTGHRPVDVEQHTESARRPIVRTIVRYPHMDLRLTAFGHLHNGRRIDVVIWKVTAHADVPEVLGGLHLDACLRDATLACTTDDRHEVRAVPRTPEPVTPDWFDDLPHSRAEPVEGGLRLRSATRPLLGAHPAGFRPACGFDTEPMVLRGGESTEGAILVPLDDHPVRGMDLDWARAALRSERGFWDEAELMPTALEVPDEAVQDLLVASSRNILQAREIEDGLPVLHVGPTIYRGLWLVDGHFLLETARYLGFDDVADAGLDVLLRRANEDGSFRQMNDVPFIKETGIAIATLVRQTELSGDVERLAGWWPRIDAAVRHLRALHEEAKRLPEDHPLHGLLPESFGDGGLGGARAEFTTVVWVLTGLRYAIRGAELLGRPAEAAAVAATYDELHKTFEETARRHRTPAPHGGHYLPMCPPGSGSHLFYPHTDEAAVPRSRRIQPETATWALCQAVWPGEVFTPDEEIVQDLLALFDARDDAQGLPATTGFLAHQAVWAYAGSFAAHVWLYAGRGDKAADYLYAFANHAAPTRVWREEQALSAGGHSQICGDMPHNWASGEFIRLVRHLLVLEHRDDLRLLAGLPDEWVRDGAVIRVEDSPTRFGRVSLNAQVWEGAFRVTVTRRPPSVLTEERCLLTLPADHRGRIDVDGHEAHADEHGVLSFVLPPDGTVTIEAYA